VGSIVRYWDLCTALKILATAAALLESLKERKEFVLRIEISIGGKRMSNFAGEETLTDDRPCRQIGKARIAVL
jgi:hypothetical protein